MQGDFFCAQAGHPETGHCLQKEKAEEAAKKDDRSRQSEMKKDRSCVVCLQCMIESRIFWMDFQAAAACCLAQAVFSEDSAWMESGYTLKS